MATAKTSRQCSKCKDNIGSFNCVGCKQLLCTRCSVEHRQELNDSFEQLMAEVNIILQQIQDNEQQNELFKKSFYDRIDEWENHMIERVHERTKQIRQQLNEFVNNRTKTIMNNIQSLTNEIRTRHEKEDFLEGDIEQIKQNINRLEKEISNSTEQSDINLHIESNDKTDWNNLIYFGEKSNTACSSVTSKQGTENAIHSNTMQNLYKNGSPFYNPTPPNLYNALYPTNVQIIPPYNVQRGSGNSASNTTTSQQLEKRQRKPLYIVDPVSHRPVQLSTLSSLVNNSHTSSQDASIDDTSRLYSRNEPSTNDRASIQSD